MMKRFLNLTVSPLWLVYSLVLSGFYASTFTGQVLGFAGFFQKPWTFILLFPAWIGAFILLWQQGSSIFSVSQKETPLWNLPGWIQLIFYLFGLTLVILLILIPISRFPQTILTPQLNWDAGLYHFPKAIELFRSGSAWDFGIDYAQYPFGYESLLALSLNFTPNIHIFNIVHLLITIWLFLTLWLLLDSPKVLPRGFSFFCTAVLLTSGLVTLNINPWQIYAWTQYTVGKNDLLLGTALGAALLFSPIGIPSLGKKGEAPNGFPIGLAMCSMVALSIKPNGFPVVAFLWIPILWQEWKTQPANRRSFVKKAAVWTALVIPGLLWAIRNLVVQGALITSDVASLQSLSILNNLSNPNFFRAIPALFWGLVGVNVVLLCASAYKKIIPWQVSLAFCVLLLTFIWSPASASTPNDNHPDIAWRFGIALITFLPVPLLLLFRPLATRLVSLPRLGILVGLFSLIMGAYFTYKMVENNLKLLELHPENEMILVDGLHDPKGTAGYTSPYDYVQKNIRNSVIHVENGLPFYIYDPAFTNTTSRSFSPDYLVMIRFPKSGSYPNYAGPGWEKRWTSIYEDGFGGVFKPR